MRDTQSASRAERTHIEKLITIKVERTNHTCAYTLSQIFALTSQIARSRTKEFLLESISLHDSTYTLKMYPLIHSYTLKTYPGHAQRPTLLCGEVMFRFSTFLEPNGGLRAFHLLLASLRETTGGL